MPNRPKRAHYRSGAHGLALESQRRCDRQPSILRYTLCVPEPCVKPHASSQIRTEPKKNTSIEWPHSGRTSTRRVHGLVALDGGFASADREGIIVTAKRDFTKVCPAVEPCRRTADQPANQSASPPCHADFLPCRPSVTPIGGNACVSVKFNDKLWTTIPGREKTRTQVPGVRTQVHSWACPSHRAPPCHAVLLPCRLSTHLLGICMAVVNV